MNKNTIIALAIGLIIGIGGTVGVTVVTNNDAKAPSNQTMDHGSMSMADMNKELAGKTGDDFDKAFLEMMIAHHQGAVDMANLASAHAKHEEIRALSQEIITAQNKEIADMRQWQMDWGYKTNNSATHNMDH